MSTEVQEMPEQGEIVLATVTKVMDHGAYVTLDEYDNLQGFLHVSEIAPGWIRSVNRFVKIPRTSLYIVFREKEREPELPYLDIETITLQGIRRYHANH